MKRKVAILGSTGSIGTQALEVIAAHPERFEVVGLAAGRNAELLQRQARDFAVQNVSTIADGADGIWRIATQSGADIVLAATDGFVAFDAVFAAVERGIDVAIANKELIVAAGTLLMQTARKSGATIIPVDSEHSAIFQCLVGEDVNAVNEIILTASGGPFRTWSAEEMSRASVDEALAHPTWQMGNKNTVDSATLMNKGLEVIEASALFGLPVDRVRVVIHPQSIAHGFVVFADGSVKSQLAAPDMRLPIGYALAYPDRLSPRATPRGNHGTDPLHALGAHPEVSNLRYDFERPDLERFPCLRLAYEAGRAGGTMPAALSAANEVAVRAFVGGTIGFAAIPEVIEKVMSASAPSDLTLHNVRQADAQARALARSFVAQASQRAEV